MSVIIIPNESPTIVIPENKKVTAHLSRKTAEGIDPTQFEHPVAIISINEPHSPDGVAKLLTGWSGIAVEEFWDVLDDKSPGTITDAIAEGIAWFIIDHYKSSIFIHCRAGVSRSAAIARLLSENGWEAVPGSFFMHANITVYNKIKKHFLPLIETVDK